MAGLHRPRLQKGYGRYYFWGTLAAVGLFILIGAGKLFETNVEGYRKILQVPVTGTMKVFSQPGMFMQLFGHVWTYKEAGTYTFSTDNEAEGSASAPPVEVRFNDAGRALVSGKMRFILPASDENLLNIHQQFRSYDHMVEALVQPAVNEALLLSASLMTAEESYAGRRAEFAELARDQILNGVYLTRSEIVETTDPLTGEKTTTRAVKVRVNEDGQALRKPNPLAEFGVQVTQFNLDKDLNYEEGVLQQIQTQRDAYMKTVTARAEAIKAEQDRKTAEAKGKANVMQAKYTKEVEKIEAVVTAQKNLEVAELDKRRAAEEKQANILRGQGEAERKRLVINADGALAQKLATYEKVMSFWANAYAQRKVPTTVFGAGGTGQGSDESVQALIQLLTAKSAKDISVDLSTR